ncbi:MAG: hypothetical protein KJ737_14650 [Proteobacteria bacterium]|nr:hypothetical protein [Pseudomonadota bacterium]
MQKKLEKKTTCQNNVAIFSKEDVAIRKKAVFDAMGKRGQQRILRVGYDQWDPFEEPKDPIDIRRDGANKTSQMLIREFLQTRNIETYSNAFAKGAFDLCLGIINKDDKYQGMFEFACWYYRMLEKEKEVEGKD